MSFVVISIISIIIFIIPFILVLKKTKNKNYECNNCHTKFVPTYKDIILSVYSDKQRYLHCPNCNKSTWCKAVKEIID